jgi:hypothetical protein
MKYAASDTAMVIMPSIIKILAVLVRTVHMDDH